MNPHQPKIAVVIATCSRPDLLNQRALSSVERQSVRPDYLVVVDDSPARDRSATRNVVNDLRIDGTQIVYLKNTRTRGLSGALNVGIDWCRRHAGPAEGAYVAILDDDDRWAPEHLELCRATALLEGAEMVISGLVRHAGESDPGRPHAIPRDLDEAKLLAEDTHIQGSNLFVRLDTLLQAGLFDELLRSSTDRDLCLRLRDLGARVTSTTRHTVHHYAETHRARLSAPGTPAKLEGLEAFYWKHGPRMAAPVHERFVDRGRRYFDWQVPAEPALPGWALPSTGLPAEDEAQRTAPHGQELVLVAAVIADAASAHRLGRLLDDLLELAASGVTSTLDVVVLENGADAHDSVRSTIDRRRARGLSIFHATPAQQRLDANAEVFGAGFGRPEGRAAIAQARVMLGSYARRAAAHREGAVVWILDDDFRLDNLSDGACSAGTKTSARLPKLLELRARGAAVVLGTVTDAPPVPFSSAVRVQMVDAWHNLRAMAELAPEQPLPHRRAVNRRLRSVAGDYHYDLSRRDTHLLEYPFWLEPVREGEAVREAFERVVARLPRVFAGEQVFRPLLLRSDADPVLEARPSIQCGGNTFVFDPSALADFPHAAPRLGAHVLRRSDMNWALLNRYAGGRRVVQAPISVRHDRSDDAPNGLDLERLIPDIQGYATYSALDALLTERRELRLRRGLGAQEPDALDFSPADVERALEHFRKFLEERIAAFALSFHRIMGLGRAFERLLDPAVTPGAIWNADAASADAAAALRAFVADLRGRYTPELLEEICARARGIGDDDVRRFLTELRGTVETHRAARLPSREEDAWFRAERVSNAVAMISVETAGDWRLLGTGSEGVALTDGRCVTKVFDYAKSSFSSHRWAGLRALVGRPHTATTIYPVDDLRLVAGRPVLRYAYEPSTPYAGGRGPEMVRLLRESRALELVFTNVAPKNLVVTSRGVRLIDYGADIRPYEPKLFETMVKKAWITMSCADRPDVAQLLRRAIYEPDLPELRGWERMLRAVDVPSKGALLDGRLVELISRLAPASLLDFGCGRGEVARALAARGVDVTGYDPDTSLRPRWATAREVVEWTHDLEALRAKERRFDVVTANLVLCVIEDDQAYRRAIDDVARSLAPDGRLVVSVCSPFETLRAESAFQARRTPEGVQRDTTFTWEKTLGSGARRRDVHRPVEALITDLERAGLTVDGVEPAGSIDLESFEPSAEILILEARHAARARAKKVPRRSAETVPVLCYHRVLSRHEGGGLERFQRARGTIVDLETFTHHAARIRERFHCASATELVDWLRGRADLPEHSCVVTFDDGYVDFADQALPILRAFGLRSTLFAVEACSGPRPTCSPVDELYLRLAAAHDLREEVKYDWAFGAAKRAFLEAAPEEQQAMLAHVGPEQGAAIARRLYLDEARLRGLGACGVTLGSHAATHALLTTLSDDVLRASLARSKAWIAGLAPSTGSAILAYPSGRTDDRVARASAAAGYDAAFTVEPRRVWAGDDLLRLPRICVPNVRDAIDRIADGEEVGL